MRSTTRIAVVTSIVAGMLALSPAVASADGCAPTGLSVTVGPTCVGTPNLVVGSTSSPSCGADSVCVDGAETPRTAAPRTSDAPAPTITRRAPAPVAAKPVAKPAPVVPAFEPSLRSLRFEDADFYTGIYALELPYPEISPAPATEPVFTLEGPEPASRSPFAMPIEDPRLIASLLAGALLLVAARRTRRALMA